MKYCIEIKTQKKYLYSLHESGHYSVWYLNHQLRQMFTPELFKYIFKNENL